MPPPAWLGVPRYVRALFWYYRRPLLGYFLLFVASVGWIFALQGTAATGALLFLLPWLLPAVVVLNLPLIGGALRRLTLPLPVRRNHALEHGTIQILRQQHGTSRRMGGKAQRDGFRLSGTGGPEEIEAAFDRFVRLPPAERTKLAVADQCGSMLVVTQGLGLLVLLATVGCLTIWNPSRLVVAVVLGLQFAVYLLGRRPLGRLLQAKRLLALDFCTASIRSITKVRSDHFLEHPPTYLVRTEIDA